MSWQRIAGAWGVLWLVFFAFAALFSAGSYHTLSLIGVTVLATLFTVPVALSEL